MKPTLPIEVTRFKEVREALDLTQHNFAKALEIKGSTADIERGKSKITGGMVVVLMEKFQVNPLWLYGKSTQKQLNTTVNTSPKVLTVTPENNEGIVFMSPITFILH